MTETIYEGEETLLEKARQNLQVAKYIRRGMNTDDAYLNYVGYHLQQAVEMLIKHCLELNGVRYRENKSNFVRLDISQLISLLKDSAKDAPIPEYIDEHSEMFTLWESKTRYILNYRLESRKVDAALEAVEQYYSLVEKYAEGLSLGEAPQRS